MTIPQELLPVLQITLPLLGGMWIASHAQNKRLDDLVQRVTAIESRLAKIEETIRTFGERLARLEERGRLVNK